MKITMQGVTQQDFDYAVECLLNCQRESAKEFGFNYPYFVPGGMYGEQWWQLDSSLALSGYKWIDRKFCEKSLWNFIESQKEDGRICLWGADILPKTVAGGDCLEQTEGVSSLPKIFDVTYGLIKGSSDNVLKEAVYNMLKKYNDWWFSNRLDKKMGLITAVFEETFIPYLGSAGEYAPVDTNVEICVACHYMEQISKDLGKNQDTEVFAKRKTRLKESINKYLWNEKKGAYYPYSIKDEKITDCLMASTFYPLRLCIADKDKQEKLIKLLKNHEQFNWDTIPLTSVSKLDSVFTTTKGDYVGNRSWSGNVWTLINEMVIRGLLDCKEQELAAELALKTIYAFNSNCAEFINPFDGSGHGVIKYAWTAAQYIELIVEVIFGVDSNGKVSPNLTKELKNTKLALENIILADGKNISVFIEKGIVRIS